jgi:hypothetical protein
VIALPRINDVHHEASVEFKRAKTHGREIGGCVEETTVRLLNEQRSFAICERHHHRATIALRESRLRKGVDHASKSIAEETLAAIVLSADFDVERSCGFVDLLHRHFDEALPKSHNFRIARLQANKRLFRVFHRRACGFVLDFELGNAMGPAVVLIRGVKVSGRCFLLCAAIRVVQIIERKSCEISAFAHEFRKRHGDRKTPITKVIFAPNLAAQSLEDTRE